MFLAAAEAGIEVVDAVALQPEELWVGAGDSLGVHSPSLLNFLERFRD
jgi:hypothetical protein